MRIVLVLFAFGCGEKEPSDAPDEPPVVDTDTEPAPAQTEDTGGGGLAEALLEPPTGITEPCWAWELADVGDDDEVDATTLEYYLPDTLQRTWYQWDSGPDGESDTHISNTYDAAGNLVSYWIDVTSDQDPELEWEYAYDADNLRTRYAEDSNGDGVWDLSAAYTYIDGLRAGYELDEGDDGTVEMWFTYTRDAEGRALSITGDRGNDGTIEERYTYEYTDPTSDDVTLTWDDGNDGSVEETWIYDYEGEQLVHYENEDLEGNWVQDYTYTEEGSDYASYTSEHTLPDGAVDVRSTYTFEYEAPGRRTLEVTETDTYGDGTVDTTEVETTEWFCP